jgi:hypothetical protein
MAWGRCPVADQIELLEEEEHVRQILLSRRNANASGQRGEDVQNIRAAFRAAHQSQENDHG